MNYEFDIWYKTKDPIFSDISLKSRLPEKWVSFKYIKHHKNSIIKPINRYVESLYPPPSLVSIEGNIVTLRQGNHAEIFLLKEENKNFYNLDRPWMRQYYNTNYKPKAPLNCFPETYKFYAPWYIDADVEVFYKTPNEESPFFIYETNSIHKKIKDSEKYIEPDFVAFNFKKEGPHMDRPGFGKIMRQSAMFYIVFECDDIMLREIRSFYEYYKVLSV